MRIVHLIARLNDGGPARVVANLARELGKRGHEVRILAGQTTADEPSLAGQFASEGLAIETLRGFGRRISLLGDVMVALALFRRLRALAPDIIHTHTAKAGVLGRLVARLLRIPVVHTYHGHVLSGYFTPAANGLARAVERFAAKRAHHHALTRSQFTELHGHFGIGTLLRWHILPVPVQSIRPYVAEWQARLVPARAVIGFVGRLAAVKDCALFLETLSELDRIRPVQGLICGDGALRGELEQRAATLGLPVLFTGYVPADEAFAAIDVLLMTSRNEGLPLVAVEAGSCAVPVVAPPVGGLTDLAEEGAVLLAERTAPALAQACAAVLSDESRRLALTSAGAALAARCRPAALAVSYEAMYAAVCEGG
jgi:glycosyltransferase involved in cell wall biosynthesis